MVEFFRVSQNWCCPSCRHNIILVAGDVNDHEYTYRVARADNGANGHLVMRAQTVACRLCGCFTSMVGLYRPQLSPQGAPQQSGDGGLITNFSYRELQLYPLSTARRFSAESVPDFILRDYSEASAVVDISPRAAMALARRCLQGIVRDFYEVNKKTLHLELEEIKTKLPVEAWAALMAIKGLGNYGAHPESDPALSPDITAAEATHALGIIAYVIDTTYVERHRRADALAKMVEIHASKHS